MKEIIRKAQGLRSSDIHIEAYETKCRIRFRLDGRLMELAQIKKADYPMLINRVKIMAGLDISEKRLPQDGRIHFKEAIENIDIRVSVLPTLYGEKIVLRLLGTSASHLNLDDLGFSSKDLERYKEGISKPHGIILISGPTGSGKTTTLYATLKLLNRNSHNILTVEDPIEYTLDGINQSQVKEDIGLTFSKILRSFLRQDPDIIMVGEIRDAETASLAVRAALTGHLVLSTIHTNSAWGTISRLVDMGIQPFLLSNTLNTSIAQRLLRMLCPFCKKEEALDEMLVPGLFKGKLGHSHYTPVGCKECHFTGYKGRKAIYEVIPIEKEIGDLISSPANESDHIFRSLGISTLQEGALVLFLRGDTSLDEVYPFLLSNQF
jgi:general secretion pathway protein E/type IV pilus assembly protein PilB